MNLTNCQRGDFLLYQAHRGVCSEFPENTFPSFEAAILQGYDYIETDPSFTADGVCVLFHDKTLVRTCRMASGSLDPDLKLADITYAQAMELDAGIAKAKKFAGTKIPKLTELLSLAKDTGVTVKLDNKIGAFTDAQTTVLYDTVASSGAKTAFTCQTIAEIQKVLSRFPAAEIHYDGPVDSAILQTLSCLIPREKLFVWLAVPNEKTAWVEVPRACDTLCDEVKRYASLGIWIIEKQEELDAAVRFGADIIETAGHIKPRRYEKPVDCHTHTKFSHDSKCEPEESLAVAQKSLSGIAFTDHCDIEYCETIDVIGPIRASVRTAKELNCKNNMKVFSGIELGEACWHPNVVDALISSEAFDVVLGSVHAVRYRDKTKPYSGIDFSVFSDREINEYMRTYFADVREMAETMDFDVLTHLHCPLRYIRKKYERTVDLRDYAEQIDGILRTVIARSIALEVNTGDSQLGVFRMHPEKEILARYRELGGYLITLGSDAHIAENVGGAFDETICSLIDLRFENAYYYTRRRPVQYALVK